MKIFKGKNKNIRQFTDKDCQAIMDVYSKSKLDELRFENKEFQFLPLNEDKKRLKELKESEIFVYEKNRKVIGFSALHDSEIRALFVLPIARGKGVGKSLLEHLLSKSIEPEILYVAKSNTPAKTFYSNYGFVVTDEFKTSYNGVQVCANKMVRNLAISH